MERDDEPKVITEFQGMYRFLSNFWECPVTLDGFRYRSAEHAYQAAKATTRNQALLVAAAFTPGEAKRRGRSVTVRPDWEQVKDAIMLQIVRAKFSQNQDLKEQLLATDDLPLEEGNYWGDRYWGVCPAGSGDGKNRLGEILMQVRDELR